MPTRKATVIETMAGLRSGKGAVSFPSMSTHTVGLRTMSATVSRAPVTMEATAPAVVKRRQTMESSSAGKLALQAMANARPTMNATFWSLKRMPSSTAAPPKTTVDQRATRTCSASVA